jgi:hypothetical protein
MNELDILKIYCRNKLTATGVDCRMIDVDGRNLKDNYCQTGLMKEGLMTYVKDDLFSRIVDEITENRITEVALVIVETNCTFEIIIYYNFTNE